MYIQYSPRQDECTCGLASRDQSSSYSSESTHTFSRCAHDLQRSGALFCAPTKLLKISCITYLDGRSFFGACPTGSGAGLAAITLAASLNSRAATRHRPARHAAWLMTQRVLMLPGQRGNRLSCLSPHLPKTATRWRKLSIT